MNKDRLKELRRERMVDDEVTEMVRRDHYYHDMPIENPAVEEYMKRNKENGIDLPRSAYVILSMVLPKVVTIDSISINPNGDKRNQELLRICRLVKKYATKEFFKHLIEVILANSPESQSMTSSLLFAERESSRTSNEVNEVLSKCWNNPHDVVILTAALKDSLYETGRDDVFFKSTVNESSTDIVPLLDEILSIIKQAGFMDRIESVIEDIDSIMGKGGIAPIIKEKEVEAPTITSHTIETTVSSSSTLSALEAIAYRAESEYSSIKREYDE